MLDAATLAIQELLKHYSTAEGLESLQPQDGGSGGPYTVTAVTETGRGLGAQEFEIKFTTEPTK